MTSPVTRPVSTLRPGRPARPGRYDPENPHGGFESVPARHAALMGAAAGIRPASRRQFPVETVLLVLGGVLLPVGIIAIIIGWYGTAHTGHVYEQNAYIISGGMLGLGLVFAGGFLYFGYWMTRQIHTTTAASQQMLRALGRIEELLAAGNPMNGATHYAETSSGPPSGVIAPPGRAQFVATERGSLFHRPTCAVVANKDNLRVLDSGTKGFRPCQICSPADD